MDATRMEFGIGDEDGSADQDEERRGNETGTDSYRLNHTRTSVTQ